LGHATSDLTGLDGLYGLPGPRIFERPLIPRVIERFPIILGLSDGKGRNSRIESPPSGCRYLFTGTSTRAIGTYGRVHVKILESAQRILNLSR